ncbi:MAG TPA: hypothetical protein VN970_02625, partial [Thermoanaerobaculia bacterium]|nr:hypothetical protein [Thermoanaerobaculia bacterium]
MELGAADDVEAFPLRGFAEPVIEADEWQGSGPILGCHLGSGQLERVSSAQVIIPEEASGHLADCLDRRDLL